MNLPALHLKAFDWMCRYRDSHPYTYFVFRKSSRKEHTLENGYCFTGSDNWACLGLTTENNRSTHNTISVGFTPQKTYIHIGYDNSNPYGTLYDSIVSQSGFQFTTSKDNTKTCYTYNVNGQGLDKALETIVNLAGKILPTNVIENVSNYKKEFKKVIKIMKPYQTYVDTLSANKNLILTGAPGTGKTYLAKEVAKAMTGDNDENNHPHYEMVQFHPSYDYSDFVEGLRPVNATGNIGFERKDGVFKAFCKKALEGGFENDGKGNYVIVNDDSRKKNLKPKENQQKYVFIIDEINRGEMSKIFGELFFTIDPGYRGIDGRIKTQYANLTEHPNEFDKALGIVEQKDTNGKVINAEDFGYFFVPENVYIIGTMNDIDRSVESMDFAMRRRFAFKEVRATDRESMLDEKITDAAIRSEAIIKMCNVNYRIQTIEGLNEAYHVGPAYFGKIEGNDFDELWNNHIKGLLNEYLRGMPNAKELLDSLERAYQKTELYVKLNNNGDLELDANKSEDWKNKIINKQ